MICKSRNINISLSRGNRGVINEIEKKLKEDNVYFENDSEDKRNYNINTGFDDVEDSEWFEEYLEQLVVNRNIDLYYETETF